MKKPAAAASQEDFPPPPPPDLLNQTSQRERNKSLGITHAQHYKLTYCMSYSAPKLILIRRKIIHINIFIVTVTR